MFSAKRVAESFEFALARLSQERADLLQRAATLEETINVIKGYAEEYRRQAEAGVHETR